MKNSTGLRCLLAAIFFFTPPEIFSQNTDQSTTFSFNLTNSANTSAGIFNSDSALIRTLWSNVRYDAGIHTASWDGKDDEGAYVPDGTYSAKILSNNVAYQWQGVVGNTSVNFSGPTVHHPMQMITNMVQVGNEMYFAVGYNEQGQAHGKFAIGSPNIVTTSYKSKGAALRFLATDGSKVYFGGQAWEGTPVTFVSALSPNASGTDAMTSFSNGTNVTNGATTYSAFNVVNDPDHITGIAVQRSGNYLFAANRSLNRLTVYNRITGTLVQTHTHASPREIACTDTDLWMITGTNTVSKYPINANGTLGPSSIILAGLTEPLALNISPDGTKLAIIDRGIYHQVKFYSTATGMLLQTVGRAENYSIPTVYDDKFYFNNTRLFSEKDYGGTHAFVSFQSDGSFWVGDYGNMRCQHFTANGIYIDNIQYMGYSYSSQTDINNPTRVFSDFLEFEIDYSKSLAPGNGSWKFIRNWSWNITYPTVYDASRMKSVTTLNNGKTYALYIDAPFSLELIELVTNSGIRHTGIHLESHFKCDLNSDGSIWQIGNNIVGQSTFWKRKLLNGFDGSNNPIWGNYENIETSPLVLASDPLTTDGYLRRNNLTSSGIVTTFSSDNGTNGRGDRWHLGGIKNGKWLFKTSPSTHSDYMGEFPSDGTYDIGNYVRNAGNYMQVVDKNIFWGYNGEFWKGLQTNKYNHYYDNGLFVGQFGVAGNIAKESGIEAYPGMAGNANSGTYVKIGDDIYFYHCDENAHAGVHSWKISNLGSIKEQSIPVIKLGTPQTPAADCINLMDGLPYNQTLVNGTAGWTRNLPDYFNAYYDQLVIATNRTTYKNTDRDVFLMSYPSTSGKIVWIKKSLGTNNLTTWSITGEAAWIESAQNGDDWIEILDANDRVITRLNRVDTWPSASMKGNNTTIVSAGLDLLYPVFNKLQPFSFSASGSSVTIAYANYAPVTVPILDPLADISKPATFRVQTYSTNAAGHQMAIARLKFCPALNSTPSAPVVVADDITDILSASSTLGNSEIEVSENGGAYVAYTGQISVGNVSRVQGYWKFKIRSAAGRNESTVVESPAFTIVNSTPSAPVVVADDVTDILSASSTLGNSEIEVSENGGAYVAYTGQISVGNVSRVQGYWKFKIRSAAGRNESTVVESPAFTIVNSTPSAPVVVADDVTDILSASSTLGNSEIEVSENGGAYVAYTGQISVGNVSRVQGYWKFKIRSAAGRNESTVVESPAFTIVNSTPSAPVVVADDVTDILSASSTLGNSEIEMSENGGAYVAYTGQISVGNVSRVQGYWKFKIRSAAGRNESTVVESPAFTIVNSTPSAPVVVADDVTDILSASSTLGNSEIEVSENGTAYVAYTGQTSVGNVSRVQGYWKFKIRSAAGRNESTVVESPAFTIVNSTPSAPVVVADDVTDILSASSTLGNSEIEVSENGGAYVAYTGQISVGNVSRVQGYWKFKIRSAAGRNESTVVESPAFTIVNSTPSAPVVVADDVTDILSASSTLGNSEIEVSEKGGAYVAYTGQISVGNVSRVQGYWKFKIRSAAGRNESTVVESPAFTIVNSTPSAPVVVADDVTDILSASSTLGNSEIEVSENGGAYVAYTGQISVGNVSRVQGYWKFKIRSAAGRNESTVVESPAFTIVNSTPSAPVVVADDVTDILSASSTLGNSEIEVSENGGAYVAYTGQISVGNVSRVQGYWKFKIRSAAGRNESTVVESPAFTIVNSTPSAPVVVADDVTDILSASSTLGNSEIEVSENGGAYVAYTGQISVGNVSRVQGYWKFKIRSAAGRNESSVVESPAFTIVNSTPSAPVVVADDVTDILSASSTLGNSEIEVSENGGAYVAYTGQISVGNVSRVQGYWKFKIRSAAGRNESSVVESPAFTIVNSTPSAPVVVADDVTDILSASSTLGNSEIEVSENGGAYVAYTGQISVGNVSRVQGYWKFKIRSAAGRNESTVVESPAFTIVNSTPSAPVVSLISLTRGSFTAPANIILSATASDADGSVNKVEFFAGASKIGEDLTAPYSVTWDNVLEGNYIITAKATDNSGLTAVSIGMEIVVNKSLIAPTVKLTSPLDGGVFTEPATITLDADASDTDGNVVKVEFFIGSLKLGEDNASPFSYSWKNVSSGTYVITAKATDNNGLTTVSGGITVSVNGSKKLLIYPNPVHQTARIEFSLPKKSYAELQIFSMQGEFICTSFRGIAEANEVKQIFFEGNQFPNGVYLCRLIYNDGSSYFQNWLDLKIVVAR